MKILIADDSILRINRLAKILERQADKEIVGTAKNGLEVLTQIESLHPDLVLLNLEDEITITKVISRKHSNVKVIILSSLEREKIDLAIQAGAKAYLNRAVSEKDLIAALDAVMRGSTTVYWKQENAAEEIASTPWSLLENWNNFLAAEIVNFWATNQQDTINFENSLESLGITISDQKIFQEFSNNNNEFEVEFEFEYIQSLKQNSEKIDLLEELEKRKEYLFEKLPPNLDSLDYIQGELEKWVNHHKLPGGYLKNKSLTLIKELELKFATLIQAFGKKVSLKESMEYLQKLEIFLFKATSKYEEKKQECWQEERECLRVYNKSFSVMSNSQNERCNFERNYQIAQNALFYLYSAQIKAEIYSSVNQALERVMQTNQSYLDALERANLFLSKIQHNFLAKLEQSQHIYVVLPLVFEQFSNHLDLESLKKEIEQELSCSLFNWGINCSISEEEVQNILVKKISPLTQKISAQLKQELNREINLDRFSGR